MDVTLLHVMFRFDRDAAHLAMRRKARQWRSCGDRSSARAFTYRSKDPVKTNNATLLALLYWRAADSLSALTDRVFGAVKGTM